jgi:hypothetical protein
MELLMERGSRRDLATGFRWFVATLKTSPSFLLQALNRGPQPLADFLVDLLLIAVPIERIQGLS